MGTRDKTMQHLIRHEVVALSEATEYAKEISALTIGERYGLAADQVVDLSLNINVFGPPEGALRAVRQRLNALYQYPDIELRDFKRQVARRHNIDPAMIFPGDGLDEVLKLIAQTFIGPGDEAIIPIPTFPRYQLEVEIMGGRPRLVPLTADFEVAVEEVLAQVSSCTKLIMLCSPNNPTGVPVSREAVRELLALGEKGPLIVVDEAMIFPSETGVMDLAPKHSNLMVLRTFSKYYGLAGARVGYAVGDPGLLRYMEVIRPPFNVNLLGEAAALGALADLPFLDQVWEQMTQQRKFLLDALARIPGIETWPSETGVLTFDVSGTGWTGPALTEALASQGVVVVDCRSYPGLEQRDVIRISIASEAQNKRFVAALQEVLGGSAREIAAE
jgi:histidinol-phosphate aminotransferase